MPQVCVGRVLLSPRYGYQHRVVRYFVVHVYVLDNAVQGRIAPSYIKHFVSFREKLVRIKKVGKGGEEPGFS